MATGGVAQRLTSSVVLMSVLFAVLVVSLYILSNTAENLDRFGQYYFWLLLTDGLVLLFIAILIGSNSLHLLREFRQRVAGSRLTVKLIAMSIFLALVPVSLVYTFSVKFLRINIDSLSDVNVEAVMNDALELSRDSLNSQMQIMKRITQSAAQELSVVPSEQLYKKLQFLNENNESSTMSLLDKNGNLLAATHPSVVPDVETVTRALAGIPYVGLDPLDEGDLMIRIILSVPVDNDTDPPHYVLQALYPVGKKASQLATQVQDSYRRYQQMVFLSGPLKLGSILTLSLALLLSVLTALWFAFYAARRMMVPIHNLVEGTRLVADGDYSIRIYKHGEDELRYLVESFNDMTGRLEKSRNLAAESREYLESQRSYLETILRNVSTGVITFDTDGLLRTANDAAGRILGQELFDSIGFDLEDSAPEDALCYGFHSQIKQNLLRGSDWAREIEVLHTQGRRIIMCRGTQLRDAHDNIAGMVVAFDDITEIMQAQRNAAWSEVARRLAHEIKNPLTPIQLAAERLRRKYLGKMQGKDAELVDRLTHTITQQVDAMKSMVQAFAEYANTPTANFKPIDMNALIIEVADLYHGFEENVEISLELGTNLPTILADETRIRQLLHNLIKNGLEAQTDDEIPKLVIRTSLIRSAGNKIFELRVEDNGPGIPVELLEKLFEPYVTSKPKGTGLGLAIVKKIAEEHNGVVFAKNLEEGGGCIAVQLLLASDASGLQVNHYE